MTPARWSLCLQLTEQVAWWVCAVRPLVEGGGGTPWGGGIEGGVRVVVWMGCIGAHRSRGREEAKPGCRAHGGAGAEAAGRAGSCL